MGPNTTPPVHVLRGILRHLRTHCPSSARGAAASAATSSDATVTVGASTATREESQGSVLPTQSFVVQRYRDSKHAPPDEADGLRRLAQEYLSLVSAVAERGRLHQLDRGAEKKLSPMEMSRRAAARAGLQLPDLSQNDALFNNA